MLSLFLLGIWIQTFKWLKVNKAQKREAAAFNIHSAFYWAQFLVIVNYCPLAKNIDRSMPIGNKKEGLWYFDIPVSIIFQVIELNNNISSGYTSKLVAQWLNVTLTCFSSIRIALSSRLWPGWRPYRSSWPLQQPRGRTPMRNMIRSGQCRISLAASPEILHHVTVWRTWLFIAYSDERWLCSINSHTTPLVHFSLKGWENVFFERGSERVNWDLTTVKSAGSRRIVRQSKGRLTEKAFRSYDGLANPTV